MFSYRFHTGGRVGWRSGSATKLYAFNAIDANDDKTRAIFENNMQSKNSTAMLMSAQSQQQASSQWEFEENSAVHDDDDNEAGDGHFSCGNDLEKKGVQWDFEEDVNYFDEEFEEDVNYYESPSTPKLRGSEGAEGIAIDSHEEACTEEEEVVMKEEIATLAGVTGHTVNENISIDADLLKDVDVEYVEVMGIKIPKRKVDWSVEDMKYKGEFGDIKSMITGWEGFSEEAPYYDDDFLMDEEELGYNHLRKRRVDSNAEIDSLNIEATRNIEDEQYVVRDINGVAIGWSDWNENAASYFDEDHGDDDELTYGEKLVLERKAEESAASIAQDADPMSSSIMRALTSKGTNTKNEGMKNFEIPKFEGESSREFEDWDNDEHMGVDSDFGPEDES